jgi:4-amino-4-deoxy-L-arabinose transferase-like glycosyltransferase
MRITKTNFYLLLIFVLALVLRIYAANNTDVSTDEMVYSIIPLNIISAGRLGTVEQSPLFFYLTDLSYKLFGGITPFSLRLTAIIFGALSVFIIFLIAQELFKKKNISLLASFLFAVSGHALIHNTEMDMLTYFFIFLSILFFIRGLKNHHHLYLATLFLSLGILVKPIAILFVPILAVIWIIKEYSKSNFVKKGSFILSKKNIKLVLFCALIFIILMVPIFSYNYLVYQEKGITDYFFSTVLGIGETVHQGMQTEWSFQGLKNNIQGKSLLFFTLEPLIFIFGIFGLIYYFKKNRLFASLFFLSLIFPFAYLAGQTASRSHYIWISAIFSIFAAYLIIFLSDKIKHKLKLNHFITLIIILVLITTFFVVIPKIKQSHDQSITLALREYTHENIPNNAVVVIDPRIYRGIHAWVFNDKHYLEGTHFFDLMEQVKDAPNKVTVPLYYIECGPGTYCGWKPEDFQRIFDTGEQISTYFKENLQPVGEVKATHHFFIYQGQISLPPEALEAIDKTHKFWFYPVGWKYPEQAVDYYQATGFGKVVEGVGFFILWLDVILAILSIPFVFYLVFRKRRKFDS